jgi:hypothetical protein
MMQGVKGFSGVTAHDQLKGLVKSKWCSGIFNLENHDQGGSHWVCWLNDPKSRNVEYFDSFGMIPDDRTVAFLKRAGKPVWYNSKQVQEMRSEECGWFCMYYIKARGEGQAAADVLKSFHKPSAYNERLVFKGSGGARGAGLRGGDVATGALTPQEEAQYPDFKPDENITAYVTRTGLNNPRIVMGKYAELQRNTKPLVTGDSTPDDPFVGWVTTKAYVDGMNNEVMKSIAGLALSYTDQASSWLSNAPEIGDTIGLANDLLQAFGSALNIDESQKEAGPGWVDSAADRIVENTEAAKAGAKAMEALLKQRMPAAAYNAFIQMFANAKVKV